MDALIDLAFRHGALGALAAVLIVASFIAYKAWRDLKAERDFWRAQAMRALQAGEVLAGRTEGDE